MYMIIIFYYYFSQQSTISHFIPPPHACLSAKICNHTGVEKCGLDKTNSQTRIFLDECDIFEYNCDNQKDYITTDIVQCSQNGTAVSSTKAFSKPDFNATTRSITKDTSLSSIKIVNVTSTAKPSTTTSISTLNQTNTMSTFESPNKTTLTSLSTLFSKETITTESIDSNTIPDKVTKFTATTNTTESKNTTTSTMSSVTIKDTKTPFSFDSTCTRNGTSLVDSTTSLSTVSYKTTINNTEVLTTISLSQTTANVTLISTTKDSTSYDLKVENNTIAGFDNVTTTQKNCDNYPKHCDRPRTWETTVKGETRDFFQILKARYGNRAKILRATTHWPHKISVSLTSDNEGFYFGAHNEG